MRTKLGILVAGLGLFCVTAPALAHHGFDTEYDANKKVKLSGVVKQVAWTNPHMRVYIDVTDGRQGDDLEHGAHQPELGAAAGMGTKRPEGRRQGDLRRLRRQGRREPGLAPVDQQAGLERPAVHAGRT